ncbi:MAG: helix-turn-helix domain-containing protein [Candidatus Heimdallarchaeota archaeon]
MSETLGSYLKRIQEEQQLLLNDVHEKTGISTGYLIHLEDGTIKRPFPVLYHKLAEFYDVSYEYLR